MGSGHGLDVLLPVLVESVDAGEQFFICHVLFLQYHAEALALKGPCVQYLVAPARVCGEWDQQVGLMQCEEFTDGIGSRPGDDDVCQGKEVLQLILDILILHIAVQIV